MDLRAAIVKCLRSDTNTYNVKTIRAANCTTQINFTEPQELRIFSEEFNKYPDPFIKFNTSIQKNIDIKLVCYRIYYKTYDPWVCAIYYLRNDNAYMVKVCEGNEPDFKVDFNQLVDFKTALIKFYEMY